MPRPTFELVFAGNLSFENLTTGDKSETLVQRGNSYEASSGVSRRKPVGWIPPTNYLCYAGSMSGAVGIHRISKLTLAGAEGVHYSGVVGPIDSLGPVYVQGAFSNSLEDSVLFDTTGLQEEAYVKALQKLKGKTIDLGVAFAERNATARLVGGTAHQIARAVRQLRRGEVRNAMRSLGIDSHKREPRFSNWTKNWLALQYGVKPLLSDVFGACDALSKHPKESWRISAKGMVTKTLDNIYTVYPGGSNPTGYKSIVRGSKGAFCRLDAIPQNELLSSLSSVGVTNPFLVAWELVPYSFVVDWFLPIGSWLNSIDATLGYSNVTKCVSTRCIADWSVTGLSGRIDGDWKVINDYVASRRAVYVDRFVSAVDAPPLPRFKNPWSFGHMANGLSLLAQAFR